MMFLGKKYFFVKRESISDCDLWQEIGLERVGFYFIEDMKFILPCFICATFKFEDIIPAVEDTEEKNESFLTLPEIERSFRFEQPNF